MNTYFTSSRQTFETRRYDEMLALMRTYEKGDVDNITFTKSFYRDGDDWKSRFPGAIRICDRLVFFRDENGWIGKGVYTEIQEALINGKPVYMMDNRGSLYNFHQLHIARRDENSWSQHIRFEVKEGFNHPAYALGAEERQKVILSVYAKAPTQKTTPGRPMPFWRTSDGRRMRVNEMSDDHLVNTVNYLERHRIQDANELWTALYYSTAEGSYDAHYASFETRLNRILDDRGRYGFTTQHLIRDMTRVPAYRAMVREMRRRELRLTGVGPHPKMPQVALPKLWDVPDDWGGEDWGEDEEILTGGPY